MAIENNKLKVYEF
jgi:hypothetical protein